MAIPGIPIPDEHLPACATVLGFTSHILYFIRGEHHLQAGTLFLLPFVVSGILFSVQYYCDPNITAGQAIRTTCSIVGPYLASLFTSITIYRLFLHPLRHFPGPVPFRITKWWHFSKIVGRSDNYRLLHELHHQYGEVVRTGPNELSVVHPEAHKKIAEGNYQKSAWYDFNRPLVTMQSVRDRKTHDARRKVWEKAFSSKSVRDYEGRIRQYSALLEEKISVAAGKGEIVDVSALFHRFGADVMGDLAFGKSFNMLESGKEHILVDLINKGLSPLGVLTPVTWMIPILKLIPGSVADLNTMIGWCNEQLQYRMEVCWRFLRISSYYVRLTASSLPSTMSQYQM
jgi:hypothetical protein